MSLVWVSVTSVVTEVVVLLYVVLWCGNGRCSHLHICSLSFSETSHSMQIDKPPTSNHCENSL